MVRIYHFSRKKKNALLKGVTLNYVVSSFKIKLTTKYGNFPGFFAILFENLI